MIEDPSYTVLRIGVAPFGRFSEPAGGFGEGLFDAESTHIENREGRLRRSISRFSAFEVASKRLFVRLINAVTMFVTVA